MLRPTSPRPPRGTTRRVPFFRRGGRGRFASKTLIVCLLFLFSYYLLCRDSFEGLSRRALACGPAFASSFVTGSLVICVPGRVSLRIRVWSVPNVVEFPGIPSVPGFPWVTRRVSAAYRCRGGSWSFRTPREIRQSGPLAVVTARSPRWGPRSTRAESMRHGNSL